MARSTLDGIFRVKKIARNKPGGWKKRRTRIWTVRKDLQISPSK